MIFGRAAAKKSAGFASLGERAEYAAARATNSRGSSRGARDMSARSDVDDLAVAAATSAATTTAAAAPLATKDARRATTQRRMSTLPVATEQEAIQASRKQALKAFLHWQCADDDIMLRRTILYIDALFACHPFPHIVQAVSAKFGVLPPGWHAHLDDLAPGERFVGDVPRPVGGGEKKELLHSIINEIIDSEVSYFECLQEVAGPLYTLLMNHAMDPLKSSQLGIDEDQIETLFGKRLERVVATSNNLLSLLEVIALVREDTIGPVSRAGFVAKAFLDINDELRDTLAPFVSDHRQALNILTQVKRTNVKSGRLTVVSLRRTITMAGGGKAASGEHFLKVWEDFSSRSKRLRGQSVQSILIMPIQRAPRYKLLLQELDKKLSSDDAAKNDLKTALNHISTVAAQINQALRQHEKLESLVGKDAMPEIAGVRESSGKLHMSYRAVKKAAGGVAGEPGG